MPAAELADLAAETIMRKTLGALVGLVLLQGLAVYAWAEQTALDRYVAAPDDNYAFSLYDTRSDFGYTTYFISMTSQAWRTDADLEHTLWEHNVLITIPWNVRRDKHTALLFIDGGRNDAPRPSRPDSAMALIAVLSGLPVAQVRQIPNQPLYFTGESERPRTEDAILAYTLDKFLITGDEQWPVHLAMTKAAVRAMDTVQQFLKQSIKIDDFIVSGTSKRGWTTWLTAAVDPRVRAIIPISFDVLNMESQLDHHWEAYGFYSDALQDYEAFDIFCRAKSPEGEALRKIIDPYEYRHRYTMPKLILNSAGDEFFLPDSSQFYFAGLPGPRHIRYSLNTDHRQFQEREDIALAAISWIRDVIEGKPHPRFSWRFEPDGSIRLETETTPEKVLLWQATNPEARDFRLKTIGPAWTSTELQDGGNGVYIGAVELPPQGWIAFTIELTYAESDLHKADQVYTTDMRVIPDSLPFAGSHCLP